MYGPFDVDLFASRLNAKKAQYVARYPEPEAMAIDAFTLKWNHDMLYIFPPFSLIPKILQKLQFDQGNAVLIAPIWTTQSWWPRLMNLLYQDWIQLPSPQKILRLLHKPEVRHPLKQMRMGACPISGKHYGNGDFQMIQWKS